MSFRLILYSVLLTITAAALLQASDKILIKAGGKVQEAEKIAINAGTAIINGVSSVALSEIDEIVFSVTIAQTRQNLESYDELTLIDGSVLRISKFEFGNKESKFWLKPSNQRFVEESNIEFIIDNKYVQAFLRNAHLTDQKEQFEKLISTSKSFDQIMIRDDKNTMNAVDVTVKTLANDNGRLSLIYQSPGIQGKESTLSWTRPEGLYLQLRETASVQPIAFVYDGAGSKLAIKQVEIVKDMSKRFTTVSQFTIPQSFIASVQRLDFASARGVSLAKIPNEFESTWASFLGQRNQFSFNETITGERLFLTIKKGEAARHFSSGVCLIAGINLRFKLPKKFRSLSAFVGVDARNPIVSNGFLEFLGDGKRVAETEFHSGEAAIPLKLDLQAIETLTIRLNPDKISDIGTNVCLGDAVLSSNILVKR